MSNIIRANVGDVPTGNHPVQRKIAEAQAEAAEFRNALMREVARRVQLQTLQTFLVCALGNGTLNITQQDMEAATKYDVTIERVKDESGKVKHLVLGLMKRKDEGEADAEDQREDLSGVREGAPASSSKEGS